MAKKIRQDVLESEVNPYTNQLLRKTRMGLIEPSDSVKATLDRHIRDFAVSIVIPTNPDAANGTPSKSGNSYKGDRFESTFKNGVYGLRLDLSAHQLKMK